MNAGNNICSKDLHKYKGVVIDTGPLLIVLTGLYGRNIKKFNYNEDDFILINNFLKIFLEKSEVFITPEVLAEISNLSKNEMKEFFYDFIYFSKIKLLQQLKEIYINKHIILSEDKLLKYGFTDISLIKAAENSKILLTSDIAL